MSDLSVGVYEFICSVQDARGQTTQDTILITVVEKPVESTVTTATTGTGIETTPDQIEEGVPGFTTIPILLGLVVLFGLSRRSKK